MAQAMEACARDGIEIIVLDRPNPIGGHLVEGNLIEASHLSFVGLYSLPNRHGMTAGEIARLVNEEYGIECLTVIPLEAAPLAVVRRDRSSLGASVPQHAHSRDRHRVPGRLPLRGN
jgi:uncharacterized protein YbbC (DUF1343 family)